MAYAHIPCSRTIPASAVSFYPSTWSFLTSEAVAGPSRGSTHSHGAFAKQVCVSNFGIARLRPDQHRPCQRLLHVTSTCLSAARSLHPGHEAMPLHKYTHSSFCHSTQADSITELDV